MKNLAILFLATVFLFPFGVQAGNISIDGPRQQSTLTIKEFLDANPDCLEAKYKVEKAICTKYVQKEVVDSIPEAEETPDETQSDDEVDVEDTEFTAERQKEMLALIAELMKQVEILRARLDAMQNISN